MILGISAESAFWVYYANLIGIFAARLAFLSRGLPLRYWILNVIIANAFVYQAFEFPKISLATLVFIFGSSGSEKDSRSSASS